MARAKDYNTNATELLNDMESKRGYVDVYAQCTIFITASVLRISLSK